jgi:hypothetical protein
MGQYYKPCCLQAKQYLYTHTLGDGLKLMEFGMSGYGTLSVLAAAIAATAEHTGAWAGKQLVITGDYADEGSFVPEDAKDEDGNLPNLYGWVGEAASGFEDASIALKGDAERLGGLTVRGSFRSQDSVVAQEVLTKLKRMKRVTCIDELFELFNEALNAEAVQSMECLMRGIRVSGIHSSLAWGKVKDARWTVSTKGERSMSATIRERGGNWEFNGPHHEVALSFPMTSLQVAKQLGFEEFYRKA